MAQPAPGGAYVVHARSLSERRAALTASLAALRWRATWIEERDPADRGFRALLRQPRRLRLSSAQVDVYFKHLAAMRRIAAGAGAAFVLEDDAMLSAELGDRLAAYMPHVPDDFDVVWFGASCNLSVPADPGSSWFGFQAGSRSMSGYLITPRCARALAADLETRPMQRPIDLALNHVVRERGLRSYWSVPALIENGSEIGRFPRSIRDGRVRRGVRRVIQRALGVVG
jgi:GR25 family glycosyltransferase involved in LPS biosynthesis